MILLEQVVERGAADPEQLGRARDIIFGAGQRLTDGAAVRDFRGQAQIKLMGARIANVNGSGQRRMPLSTNAAATG